MKKIRNIGTIILLVAIIFLMISGYRYLTNWTVRYQSVFDDFFGENNWSCVEARTRRSRMHFSYDNPGINTEKHRLRYREWSISFKDLEGTEWTWDFSNLTAILNHKKYLPLSSKRYSNREAIILELMDLSQDWVGEEVKNTVISQFLSEEELESMGVWISYKGGNPSPDFYSKLAKEEWFHLNTVTAKDYLAYDEYEFFIDILVYVHIFEDLTKEQQENMIESYEPIIDALCEEYGEDASFRIYFDDEHTAEYKDGVRCR